jgi:hypothetical protein
MRCPLVREDIHLILGELPRGHAALEEQIQLSESATTRLGDTEVGVYDAQEAYTCPEEAGVVAPKGLLANDVGV